MKQNISHIGKTPLNILKILNFIDLLKPIIPPQNYLNLTRGTVGRRALVKLRIRRISNHKLMIEIGRYNQATKDNKHYPFCGSEVHFLFRCAT